MVYDGDIVEPAAKRMLLMRATRLQPRVARRHRAFLGTLAMAQARARPSLVVSPADGQRVVATDNGAKVTLRLSTRRRVCVAATLQGRTAAPEQCLDVPHGTVDLSRIPPGRHRFAVRDEASGEKDDIGIEVVAHAPGEFVATKDWQPTRGASVPGGLDVRLPLDGTPAAAKLPDKWRLQLYVEEQKAFFRADVKPSDTVADLEAALSLWSNVPAVLSYSGAAPFHPSATAESIGLFEQRGDVAVGWPEGPPVPEAPPVRAAARPTETQALAVSDAPGM